MDLEIEAKISVPSLEPIVQKLNRLGAKMIDSVKKQAEAEGLDRVFTGAGFEWRSPGCSQ